MNKTIELKEAFLIISLASIFTVAIFLKLDHFHSIPGDIGDARFNNYILENFYQFLRGGPHSLWNPNFFYPYPYVIGFSDNLFGSGPVYSLFRLFNFESDTSYQLWFLVGYLLNFITSYYCFKKLSLGVCASLIGALVFSLGLPTSAHSIHSQLHYRFATALAITYALLFIKENKIILVNWSVFWLIFQFYCGIYIGFFTGLLIVFIVLYAKLTDRKFAPVAAYKSSLNRREKITFVIVFFALLCALVFLFYPYFQVKHLYGFRRDWGEISLMLPLIQSYFMSDRSPIWGEVTNALPPIPMSHEHQMFIGVFSGILFLYGLAIGFRRNGDLIFWLLSSSLVSCIVMTISINGYSIWYLFHQVPLFSAIRAVTRIDQVLLFPIGYICAQGIASFKERSLLKIVITTLFVALIFFEWALTPYPFISKKSDWRQRVAFVNSLIPQKVSDDSILFVAQTQSPYFADEIDAMWVALNRNLPTLNGYSGNLPSGYKPDFGNDCLEVDRRIDAYKSFQLKHHFNSPVGELKSRILFIGFTHCK